MVMVVGDVSTMGRYQMKYENCGNGSNCILCNKDCGDLEIAICGDCYIDVDLEFSLSDRCDAALDFLYDVEIAMKQVSPNAALFAKYIVEGMRRRLTGVPTETQPSITAVARAIP